ncbi:hypothetical protein HPB52_010805 [Rhipicephalus sanguineus]|uniref:Uncharacterized protein n=1 Tax=Rhipicephalus sanguineus TaxID=34632 RepID=A0A9D4Q643_RHISA|nr:hypothetical protein HPB52_010805 [Rhipicephalus sanguineus]
MAGAECRTTRRRGPRVEATGFTWPLTSSVSERFATASIKLRRQSSGASANLPEAPLFVPHLVTVPQHYASLNSMDSQVSSRLLASA